MQFLEFHLRSGEPARGVERRCQAEPRGHVRRLSLQELPVGVGREVVLLQVAQAVRRQQHQRRVQRREAVPVGLLQEPQGLGLLAASRDQ